MLFLILCVVFIAFVSREVWQMFRTKDSENVQVNHMLGVSGILLLGIGFWVFSLTLSVYHDTIAL